MNGARKVAVSAYGRGLTALHMIHRWSIEHPYAIVAFYAAVMALAGLAVTRVLPRRFAPYIESPMVGVVTMMPGLSPVDMELNVTKPIEEQLVNVRGLRYIRSTSQEGFSIVALEFDYGYDMKRAVFDVQALMNVAQANLPATGANLKPSWVIPIDPLNLPVVSFSLRAEPDSGWDMARIRQFADNTVVNRLKRIPSVYSVVPFGGYRRQMQVVVDRDKLAARNLSILDVKAAIDAQSINRPAGTLTDGDREAIVRVDSRMRSPEDVRGYPIRVGEQTRTEPAPTSTGAGMTGMGMGPSSEPTSVSSPVSSSGPPQVVRVGDVARVFDGHWERRSAYRYLKHDPGTDGQVIPSIQVSVIQDPGASSAQLMPKLMAAVRELERDHPGIVFDVGYDNARFVGVLFDNVWHELALAVFLTSIVVLLFLGEWRGTLIALITIPTSLALATLMLVPFGMTFNSGTLVGLLLSIGRLVDDSIIDIHAVERHLRMGKTPKDATVDGIAEVRLAVIASTITMALALAPLLFSGGITEAMFRELVWPLLFALIASTLVSFTLTALLCAKLLRPEAAREEDRRRLMLKPLYAVLDPFQRLLDGMERWYGRSVEWMLRHRFANASRIAATVLIGFTFYYFIGSEMMPLADVGQASGMLEMAPGTSFHATENAVKKLENIMLKYPEIEKASIEIGAESMFETWSPYFTGYQMPSANAATFMLTLSDKDRRKRTIFEVIDGVQREALATIPGIRRLQIKEMGSDVMATAAAPIHVNVYGSDLKELDRIANEVLDGAKKMPELFQPATTWAMGVPSYRIRVDHDRAQRVGLTPAAVAQQAYYAMRGGLTDEFYRMPTVRQDTIVVRYDENQRRDAHDLRGIYVTAPGGKAVPLSSIAAIEPTVSPTAIEHDGLRRVVGVTGYYRTGNLPSMDVVMNLVANAYGGNEKLGIEAVNFPPGYGLEMRGDMTQMMDSFRRLLYGLVLALALMYLVLVVQFRGFLQPLQMIASLPLELAGVFIALWLTGQAFSTVSILGIIVLTGMDLTTAVLLIDMIMRYRDQGMERDKAVVAACPQRLRPILMTAMTTMIVLVPVATFPKTGLDAYQPLAVAVLGGLTMGTLLSLFDIPIMHTYVDDFVRWAHRTYLGREWRWRAPGEEDGASEPASVAD
ncbi:MAG: efflux RND transporter permease subunit [Chthonomonadales bacterium]|nr:efflux RND transporter permease subunit [Chthonomonadales bacterium]